MTTEAAAAFDAAIAETVTSYAVDGQLHWTHQGTLVWGEPGPTH